MKKSTTKKTPAKTKVSKTDTFKKNLEASISNAKELRETIPAYKDVYNQLNIMLTRINRIK